MGVFSGITDNKPVAFFVFTMQPSGNSVSSTSSATALAHQQQMSSTVGGVNASSGGSSASTGGGRYHHREVPPRFQHSKQSSAPKHSSKTNQGNTDHAGVMSSSLVAIT